MMNTQRVVDSLYKLFFKSFEALGSYAMYACESIGSFVLFFVQVIHTLVTTQFKRDQFLQQVERIGIESINIVMLTGTFSGMVLALQSYIGFSRMGGEQFIGPVVALGMARELGPVLTGLMVTGRACSAIAAELGTMRITEQIDALRILRINIFSYLMVPRILAGIIMLPCLSLFAMLCGIFGGYIVVVYVLHSSAEQYIGSITQLMRLHDIIGGLIKSAFFGLILTWVGCYKGYYTHGGARGVGKATTQAVVLSSVLILIANFFLTKLLDTI